MLDCQDWYEDTWEAAFEAASEHETIFEPCLPDEEICPEYDINFCSVDSGYYYTFSILEERGNPKLEEVSVAWEPPGCILIWRRNIGGLPEERWECRYFWKDANDCVEQAAEMALRMLEERGLL